MKQISLKPILIFLTLFMVLLFSYVNFSSYTLTFDEKLREILFSQRGEIKTSNQIVIIDIDEKSIDALGQWPFSRDLMAQVLINLTNAQVGIIGLDIIFSENDRSSPALMAKKLKLEGNFQDNDSLLGSVIANTPTILGYYFSNHSKDSNNPTPNVNATFNPTSSIHLIKNSGVVTNIEKIQQKAYSSGFFNAYNNSHGKLTKMPLLLQHKNRIYPSLALEMIRIASQTERIEIKQNEHGLIGLELNNLSIPTDTNGFIRINYRGAHKSFTYLSFVDILRGEFDTQEIQNKLVLIGTSSITLADLRSTVFDLAMPGVEVHANVIDNILKGDFLYDHNLSFVIDLLIIFSLTFILGVVLLQLRVRYILPTLFLLPLILFIIYYQLLFEKGMVLNLFYPLVATIFTSVFALVFSYTQEQKVKTFIKDKFAKKVSQQVVEELLTTQEGAIKPSNKNVTVFFSDIRSFTNLSEKINDPERLIELLNTYMEPMSDLIIKQEGTIDKFIGDAIMAYWNAPNTVNHHEQKAVITAIEQIKALEKLNSKLQKIFDITLHIGIGIHTGVVTVGEMGSSGRSDYTIIGDNVNLASRIEGLTKYFDVDILITQTTKDALDETVQTKKLASVVVKGKEKAITIYEVIHSAKVTLQDTHNEAISFYENQQFKKAKELFLELQDKEPKKINQLYINKCEHYLSNPKETFQQAFIIDSK